MHFQRLSIPDVVLITPKQFNDERGSFAETFRANLFERNGISGPFVQDNHVRTSTAGVLRGLHFQNAPNAQAKLVRCTRGAIFDVAVDVRKGSSTFGQHVTAELSADNGSQLFVPAGFAHGYLALREGCDVHYKVTAYYSPKDERGLAWNDRELGIKWPLEYMPPKLSQKDARLPSLVDLESTI